jgi:lipoprotein-anchoring transpeptidase ErfK/SrfK
MKNSTHNIIIITIISILFAACDGGIIKRNKKNVTKEDYKKIVLDVKQDTITNNSDTTNMFDKSGYDPSADSMDQYLNNIENALEQDSMQISKIGINDSGILASQITEVNTEDTALVISNANEKFTNDIKKVNTEEIKALKYNLSQVNKKPIIKDTNSSIKKQIQSKLWAKISKKDQRLYLHIDGEIIDTFKVSTGDKKHETPVFDTKPNGLMFQKYTSKKYPGGNYNGLGNMPYVVFIKGGFAIHGTTLGNIKRLGTKASHGCVRLHPDNAKILFELVKQVGSENTWITITDE